MIRERRSQIGKVVERLVDNALRLDAAAEFLKGSGFTSYDEFESALLTCSYAMGEDFHLLLPFASG